MISTGKSSIYPTGVGMSLPWRCLQAILWSGALWLLLWNALRWQPGEQFWGVALVNYFAPWIAGATLLLAVLVWLTRQRALSLALLLSALLLGARLWPLRLSRPRLAADTPVLTMMTFNVHQRNTDVEAIIELILREDADIVALQELTPEISSALAHAVRERYRYHTLQPGRAASGQGLLSRYPLTHVSLKSSYRHQSAVIQTPEGPVTLLNIHSPSLYPLGWKRDWQGQRSFIQTLVDEVSQIQGPLLVVGDFNTTPLSENYALIRHRLQDAFAESGWGLGFSYPNTRKFGLPVPHPVVRIDYIFYSEHLRSHETYVLRDSAGSDHRPVVSRLSLPTG
jgi:endonuclease/exonuclease/phosphatase (EEP) superfamily protein YafD